MADNSVNRGHALEVAAQTHGQRQELRALPSERGSDGVMMSAPVAVWLPNFPAAVVEAAEHYARFLDGATDDIVEAEILDAEPSDARDALTVMVMQRKAEKLYAATLNDLWRSTADELALHLPDEPEAEHRRLAAAIALRFQRDAAPF